MIARPQRPQLIDSRPSLIGHRRRIGSADATAFFDPRKILMPSIALFDAPSRTFQHDASEFAPIEPDRSAAPTPAGTRRKSSVIRRSKRGCTSINDRSVRINRMPQLTS